MLRKIIFILMAVIGSVFVYQYLRPHHGFVGIMVPLEEMQAQSAGWDIAQADRRGGEFRGPVTLVINNNRIELPNAWVTFFSDSAYPTTLNVLEKKGRYTREEAINKWLEYVDMARALPDWYEEGNILKGHRPFRPWTREQAINHGISPDNTERENAEAIMNFIGPGLPMGTRKISLLSGWYRLEVNGRSFFPSFDLNMTYDKNRPDTPYRFAFQSGLHAGSMQCLSFDFQSFLQQILDGVPKSSLRGVNLGDPVNPLLVQAFEGWDYKDVSLETIRPYLDLYVFNLCDENAKTWKDIDIPRPDLTQ